MTDYIGFLDIFGSISSSCLVVASGGWNFNLDRNSLDIPQVLIATKNADQSRRVSACKRQGSLGDNKCELPLISGTIYSETQHND